MIDEYQTRRMRAMRPMTHMGAQLEPGDEFYASAVDCGYYAKHGRAADLGPLEEPSFPPGTPVLLGVDPAGGPDQTATHGVSTQQRPANEMAALPSTERESERAPDEPGTASGPAPGAAAGETPETPEASETPEGAAAPRRRGRPPRAAAPAGPAADAET